MCTLCLGEGGGGDQETVADGTIRTLLGETPLITLMVITWSYDWMARVLAGNLGHTPGWLERV